MGSESHLFLEQLFAGKPDELYVLLWTLPEKRSKWFRGVAEAVVFAESLSDHDLYVGVGLSNKDYGATQRCLSDEVGGIVGIWADLDLKSDAHPKAALPSTVEEALGFLPGEFPPSFLISTGNGLGRRGTVRVRVCIGQRIGEAQDASKPRAITHAIARALGIDPGDVGPAEAVRR